MGVSSTQMAERGHPGTVPIQKQDLHPSRQNRDHPEPWPNSPDKERARLGHIGVWAQPRQSQVSWDQLGQPIQGGQTWPSQDRARVIQV